MVKTYIPNFSTPKAKQILNKHGIVLDKKTNFSSTNIIIGANGAGKTRFLQALCEICRTDGQNVIYGYFPGLSHSKSSVIKSDDLPICTLYESLQDNEFSFDNFLREIELHGEEYIPQLLTYQSIRQKNRGEKAFTSLTKTFSVLSGKTLNFVDDIPCVNNMPLRDALVKFSPGELMIFYIAVFISLQSCSKKRIIVLDEPECHLHPKALLSFIRILKESKELSGVWIATHSLYLLPEFEFENVVYIENSTVHARNSKTYDNILNDLLGNENERVSRFFSSLSQWQYCEYIAECFTHPEVIETVNPHDEQVCLFAEFVKNKKVINVLDFGGGSARLGLSLTARQDEKTINYEICDKSPKYTGKEFNIYHSINETSKKYDCIVMMNVLHEISPNEWPDLFDKIYLHLAENGYLLFVETSTLIKGEMPNATGFLVLGCSELKTLFNLESDPSPIIIKENQKSVCVPISKRYIKRIKKRTVDMAIHDLENNTLMRLKEERIKADFSLSRYYAFLTQLYINAKLYNESNTPFVTLDEDENAYSATTYKKAEQSTESMYYLILSCTSLSEIVSSLIEHINEANTKNSEYFSNITSFLHLLNIGIYPSTKELNQLWIKFISLENTHEPRNNLALFLLALHVLGEERASKYFGDIKYEKYIRNILKSIAVEKSLYF